MRTLMGPGEAIQHATNGDFDLLKAGYISEHFTWGEVFQHCSDEEIKHAPVFVFSNAVTQSKLMERVRDQFDVPVIVHSWYRDAEHNASVDGAPMSLHLRGMATDFHVKGFEGIQGNKIVQKILDPKDFMQKAGLEWTNGPWSHVDSRGYRARFPGRR